MTQENETRPQEPGAKLPAPSPSSVWLRRWPWMVIGLVVLVSLGSHLQNLKRGAGSSEAAEASALPMIRMQSHLLIGLKGIVDRRRAERVSEDVESGEGGAPEGDDTPEMSDGLEGADGAEEAPGEEKEAEEGEEASGNSGEGFLSISDALLDDQLAKSVEDLERKAKGPKSARAVAMVLAFLGQTNAAMEVLAENPSTGTVHAATRRLLARNAPPPEEGGEGKADFEADLAELEEDLGWFAQLARLKDEPADNPERLAFIQATEASMGRFQFFQLGMVAAFAVGLVLLIMAMIRAGRGELTFRFLPLSPEGGTRALEGFAVYLVAFVLLPLGILGLMSVGVVPVEWLSGIVPAVGFVVLAVVLGLAWARRGRPDGASFRREWGLYAGEGVGREIGCGLVGYLACLPIVLVGTLLTGALEQWIVNRGGAPGTHEAALELQSSGQIGLLLLLAAVMAPIAEEVMFRGGFYGAMRRRHRVLASGFFVAFVFAAVHPQGVGFIPALMAMAIGFALLREWRGSLIAPITAHAVHNALTIFSGSLLFG